jgi:aminoglycoside phosphotransferase (APT) family kinase protein
MVHGDFRPANVLFDAGRISGVIDIEALGSGTRAFDYATLLDHSDMRPDALELLIRAGSDVAGPAVLRACLAHVVLDLVRFMRDAFASKAQLTERTRTLTTRVETVDRLTRMSRTIIR